ncbi:hypothetical protein JCM8547_007502 [Rhodosporidiobolus lusitaniae]
MLFDDEAPPRTASSGAVLTSTALPASAGPPSTSSASATPLEGTPPAAVDPNAVASHSSPPPSFSSSSSPDLHLPFAVLAPLSPSPSSAAPSPTLSVADDALADHSDVESDDGFDYSVLDEFGLPRFRPPDGTFLGDMEEWEEEGEEGSGEGEDEEENGEEETSGGGGASASRPTEETDEEMAEAGPAPSRPLNSPGEEPS